MRPQPRLRSHWLQTGTCGVVLWATLAKERRCGFLVQKQSGALSEWPSHLNTLTQLLHYLMRQMVRKKNENKKWTELEFFFLFMAFLFLFLNLSESKLFIQEKTFGNVKTEALPERPHSLEVNILYIREVWRIILQHSLPRLQYFARDPGNDASGCKSAGSSRGVKKVQSLLVTPVFPQNKTAPSSRVFFFPS